jgi:uncharacterized protein YdhG (YjbR/CyaY superfamily)
MATKQAAKSRYQAARNEDKVWTEAEQDAMKEAAGERKRAAKRRPGDERVEGERDLRAKIAEMAKPDQVMAERIHEIVTAAAPSLMPKTWYGMPAYARDGKIICFFKAASKYKERYASFGFDTAANLDDGNMWPTSFALTDLNPAAERRITELVKKAAG